VNYNSNFLKRTLSAVGLLLIALAFCCTACNRAASPPPPLAAEDIPPALSKAYSAAKPEIRGIAEKIAASLQSKDYPDAYAGIQLLCNSAEATKEQRMLATRAMLTITSLLQAAQNQGDEKAASALKVYQMTK
jgi:hypothetical protein